MAEIVGFPGAKERRLRSAARFLLDELGPEAGAQIADFIRGLPTLPEEAKADLRYVIEEIAMIQRHPGRG